jgi:hypothetical protein
MFGFLPKHSYVISLGRERKVTAFSNAVGVLVFVKNMKALQPLQQPIGFLLQISSLCRPDEFALGLEALYQRMWQAYCHGERLASDV